MSATDKKSTHEIIQMVAGGYGTPHIKAADGQTSTPCYGLVSWDDETVISSLKTDDDVERITTPLKLNAVAIPKGCLVAFGFEAAKITLSGGSGVLLKSNPFTF